MEDFNRFSTLLIQAMKINDLMSGDDIILTKLAEILTYAYAKKANGQFQIFSDFDTAKRVTSIVFATAKKLGLKFFQSDLEDLVQKILLSVVYKEGSDKKDTKNDDKKADKPKEDKPTNQPTEPKDDPNGTDNQF